MQIRLAGASDAARINSLILSLSHLYMLSPSGEGGEGFFASVSASAIQAYMAAGNFRFWVAEEGERLLGMVALRDNAHLFNLFIAAAHQRQGLGQALWQLARDTALTQGNPGEFTVNASANAVPFYARFGFVANGEPSEQHGVAVVPMRLVMMKDGMIKEAECVEIF